MPKAMPWAILYANGVIIIVKKAGREVSTFDQSKFFTEEVIKNPTYINTAPVAHDAHNIIVIGTNDEDMYCAVQALIKSGGGKVVVKNGEILAQLALPIAGLMSNQNIESVLQSCANLKKAEKELGCNLTDPFMTMGFVSLSVIPNLKITDKGLFEYKSFSFVDVVQ